MATQYDNFAEKCGFVSNGLLGLKTLTIIRDAIENISKQIPNSAHQS
ncbi:MAG: hypothetical protein IPL35_04645 [Sphingobacteriales bacterium]|nr:hypothetical protein [Sphingobacteriales bacterium]